MTDSRILALTRAALAVFWALVIFVVLVGTIEESPLRPSHMQKMNLLVMAPEGWSFFTRDPREASEYPYLPTPQGWRYAGQTNSAAVNGFGVRRGARLQGIELSALLKQVPRERWVKVETGVGPALDTAAIPVVPVRNLIVRKTLCGEVLVERRERVPWAWSRSRDRITMPSTMVRLSARCS
jgi:antimicrobial peptide system SdpA family protein